MPDDGCFWTADWIEKMIGPEVRLVRESRGYAVYRSHGPEGRTTAIVAVGGPHAPHLLSVHQQNGGPFAASVRFTFDVDPAEGQPLLRRMRSRYSCRIR